MCIRDSHKHVLVNGKQVNIPSYQVKAGDVIEIKEKHRTSPRYKEILEVTEGQMPFRFLPMEFQFPDYDG